MSICRLAQESRSLAKLPFRVVRQFLLFDLERFLLSKASTVTYH